MSRSRRYFTAEKKAQIVRRHWADKVTVSDLADEFGIQPSQIHTWLGQVLDQAEKTFERSSGSRRQEQAKEAKITHLQEKLSTKNEVIAELMEENVPTKMALRGVLEPMIVGILMFAPIPLLLQADRKAKSTRAQHAGTISWARARSFISSRRWALMITSLSRICQYRSCGERRFSGKLSISWSGRRIAACLGRGLF